ncbi:MAG: hypothetical protein LBP43_06085, partial [Treponema sp.]|nr:hypothetical protein [Treponema sp.]
MKRGMYLIVMAMLIAGTLSAQTWGRGFGPGRRMPGPQRNRNEAPETVTVRGNLGFSNGYISLEQDSITYYVLGLDRLIGFVEGLKEGAPVILEGTPFSPPGSQGDANIRFLLTDKLTFNGKEY